MKKNHIYVLLFALLLTSCDEYLDVEPKGKVIPSKVEDYDLLLNGGSYSIHTTSDEDLLFLSADDHVSEEDKLGDLNNPHNALLRYYRWDGDLFPENVKVRMWNNSYNSIYTYNLVINEVDNSLMSSNDTEQDKKRIKAEARTGRAYEYWLLVNSFAKQYDEATAASDPGVPKVTVADAAAQTNGRASVKEIYDFILADLNESVEFLPNIPKSIVRPTKETGYGLLARVYLQMGDYEKARANATLALNEKNTLGDYTDMATQIGDLYNAEQYIYRYYGYTRGFFNGHFSDGLAALFDKANDMRVNRITSDLNWVYDPATGWQQVATGKITNQTRMNINHCVSVSEMYVIRAECNARLNDGTIQQVLDDLNTLRVKRIKNYADLTTADITTKNDALKFALEERRREMIMTGMRWFDLKRLNKESEYAVTITHPLKDQTFTLTPNSNNYIFPIPADVINFNPDMELNPRD